MEVIERVRSQEIEMGIIESWYQKFLSYLDTSEKTVETYKRALRQFFLFLHQKSFPLL